MGTRKWHVSRAEHHKEVANHLRDHSYFDWAAVALAYAAHQYVHSVLSGEPGLARDERHPRKHTAPPGSGHGGRGTNQLVNAIFPGPVSEAHASLFEAGRRTRYDVERLGGGTAYALLELQYKTVRDHCIAVNKTRPDRRAEEA
jgi:hypothetical protein